MTTSCTARTAYNVAPSANLVDRSALDRTFQQERSSDGPDRYEKPKEGKCNKLLLKSSFFVLLPVLTFASMLFVTGCGKDNPSEPQQNGHILKVTCTDGVDGFPKPGSYAYDAESDVNYGYKALDDYVELAVSLDGTTIPANGSVKMTTDHALDAAVSRKVFWRYKVPAPIYYSSPAIGKDSTIYFGSGMPDNPAGTIYALDKKGVLRWSYATANSLFSPAIGDDETIYIQDHRNNVYAFSPSGSLKWIYNSYDHVYPHNVGQHTPAIGADGTVYVAADDGLHAVEPATGSRKWHFLHPIYPGRQCLASPVIGSDGSIYVTIGEDMLFAVNPDGTEKWRFSFTNDWEMSFTSPAIDANGVIYLASEGNWQGQVASNIYAVNSDGKLKWKYPVEGDRPVRASSVIGPGGMIIIATKANGGNLPAKVLALTPGGQKTWEYTVEGVHVTPDDVYSTPSVGADGVIYFAAETAYVYALNLDGTLKWKFNMGGATNWSSAAITGDGTLYIGTMNTPGFQGCLMAMKCTSMGYAATPWPRFRHDNGNRGRY